MPNDASRGELPKLGDYGNTNNIYDWQQKVYQGWPYHGPNSYQMPPYGSYIYSNVFSAPTDANNQTQKPPYVPDVASKRPHTTSDEFCTSVRCAASGHKFRGCPNVVISPTSNAEVVAAKVAAAPKSTHADDATESPHRSNTSPRTSAADDEAVARSITVVSSETASNTHLDDSDGDIVLKEIRPYAQASIDPCHYFSTANRHIFHDRSAFETYDPVTEPAQACIKGFCRSMPVSYAAGRGTVRVEALKADMEVEHRRFVLLKFSTSLTPVPTSSVAFSSIKLALQPRWEMVS
jgi:hypothetical protein